MATRLPQPPLVRSQNSERQPLAVCSPALGTSVDTFVFRTRFVPLLVPSKKGQKKQPEAEPDSPRPANFMQALRKARDLEETELLDIETLAEFSKRHTLSMKVSGPRGRAIERLAAKQVNLGLAVETAYNEYKQEKLAAARKRLSDDGSRMIFARNADDSLRRLAFQYQQKNNLSPLPQAATPQRTSNGPLVPLMSIGLLFLERLRIRPIGHTVERAPFYELSLSPGETVTLRQWSFSKRETTFEETQELTTEQKIEYSSTFTTELSEEFSNVDSKSNNWNVSGQVTGTLGDPVTGMISGALGGGYGAATMSQQTSSEASRETEQVVRKVESSQKKSHKTVIELTTETTVETESVRVLTNSDTRTRKILMRKLAGLASVA